MTRLRGCKCAARRANSYCRCSRAGFGHKAAVFAAAVNSGSPWGLSGRRGRQDCDRGFISRLSSWTAPHLQTCHARHLADPETPWRVSRLAICPHRPSGTRAQPNRQHAARLHSPSPGRNLGLEWLLPIPLPLGWGQRRHHNEGGHSHASISFPSRRARPVSQRLPCFQILHLVD